MKKCSKCGVEKPESSFTKGVGTNLRSACRDCNNSQNKGYYAKNREAVLNRMEAQRHRDIEAFRASRKEYQKRLRMTPGFGKKNYAWVKTNKPIERKARQALAEAVRHGIIVKPNSCEDCRQEFQIRQIHGHHESYDKPLDVIWLCHRCHFKRHGRFIETNS